MVRSGLNPSRLVLSSGAAVVTRETRTIPAVTIALSMRAGSICDPADAPGSMFLLARTIDRGTTHRSAADIAEDLDSRGITLNLVVTRHLLTLSCTCLSEDFRDVLAVVADVARNPVFPDVEIEKRRVETVTAIRQDLDNPGIRASEALQALLYGPSHPYGRPAKGSVESVEIDPAFQSLIITVETELTNGKLEITLDRDLIDAKIDGEDDQFIVFVDGDEGFYEEIASTPSERTLEIVVPNGTTDIEIVGTHVVPEFPIAMLVIAGVFASMIASYRLRTRL